MPAHIDKTGFVYGRLTILARASKPGPKLRWFCRCTCGTFKSVLNFDLDRRHTMSCGCLQRETRAATHLRHGLAKKGQRRIYQTQKQIISRTTNPIDPGFHRYGRRGIRLHPPWFDVEMFCAYIDAELGPPPDGFTLDRIDNERGYVPCNLRWASRRTQALNSRTVLKSKH